MERVEKRRSCFPTLPTDLGNRCGDYHIPTATNTTGMNLSRKQKTRWGQIRRAKGARSSRQNHTKLLRPVLGSVPAIDIRPQYFPRPCGRISYHRGSRVFRLFVKYMSSEEEPGAPGALRSGVSPPNPQESF